jgi:hypothetical protein
MYAYNVCELLPAMTMVAEYNQQGNGFISTFEYKD